MTDHSGSLESVSITLTGDMMFSDEFQKKILDEETLALMHDVYWKQLYWFASKWNLTTNMIDDPNAVRDRLEKAFFVAHPDLDFGTEWKKCLAEL